MRFLVIFARDISDKEWFVNETLRIKRKITIILVKTVKNAIFSYFWPLLIGKSDSHFFLFLDKT
jgi:hypothetical protein